MKKGTILSVVFFFVVVNIVEIVLMSCSDEIPTYTLRFDSQGGSSVSSIEGVKQGLRIIEPSSPTKNGYVFDGWYKDRACVVEWYFNTDIINSNTTLYAKWVVSYTVCFDTQGGSSVSSLESVRQGSIIGQPTDPTRNGYTFAGWYQDSVCTTEWNFGADTVDVDRTLYAKWVVALYTVNFDSQGGTSVAAVENVLFGAAISEPVPPVKSKHEFGGWYRESSFTQRYYFTTDVVTSSMTLYAKWLPPLTVSFDSQGGSAVDAIAEIPRGDVIPEPESPSKNGYIFNGWYKQSDCVDAWDFDLDTVMSTRILYAKWTARNYAVTFLKQGGSNPSPANISVTYGQAYGALPVITRNGYLFDGWWTKTDDTGTRVSSDTVVSITSDQTLYAKWVGPILVGGIGPAGGYIFYDKGSYSNGWRYMEAAPVDIRLGISDYKHIFGYYRTSPHGSRLLVGTATGLGTGKANTAALVAAMGETAYTSYWTSDSTTTWEHPARLCDIHEAGGYDDWFLPSKDELNQMYQNLKINNRGGFSDEHYWSSSEYNNEDAWEMYFGGGYQYHTDRGYNGFRVRPVRAF